MISAVTLVRLVAPALAALAPFIASVAVEGCKRAEAVAVSQANGDVIGIDLKDTP
jgi:hypothetical protein